MGKLKDLKKWGWLPILLLLIVVATITTVTLVAEGSTESLFNLNERDVVLAVDESKTVELESEKVNVKSAKLAVSWKSSKPSVASVDKDGTIKAASGGETKITAVVEYKGKEYSTSCVVTVKAEGNKYSTYKIRWFTQTPDRKEYEIKEETFEREVGSKVELTELDAKKNLPNQYVLNKEKSTLRGTVKSKLGVCVLEVYFDVAEVPYTVDYYYESADKLGTYTEKETKSYKAYAFTKVGVTEGPKEGFVRNDKVKGTVLSSSSVTSGTKLKVYCDRIRSNVTINYISGRASATYTNVYGVGLVGAPADALKDSVEYYTATYVNGEKKNATMKLLQGMTKDTTVDFKLDGVGFTYSLKNGVSTITNECDEKATQCYAMLKGKSNVLYLSADYLITGSTSNKFGITLNDGTTSREIRFKIAASGKSAGVMIKMDNTNKGGLLTEEDTSNRYDYTCEFDSEVFVWAQKYNTKKGIYSSLIKNMLLDRDGGAYQIQWAVYEGVLYARIEDQTVLRLPLNRLNTKWNEKTKFEIGISTFDELAWNDDLRVTNVNLKTGNAAKKTLKLDGQLTGADSNRMGYDVISGSYMAASKDGAAYAYGAEGINTGVSVNVKWVDVNNTASSAGITVKVGEESVQYAIEGLNSKVRRFEDMTWGTTATITSQILAEATPFNEQGEAKIDAFVKDGYFYVLYNGVEAQCINMLSMFSEYTVDTKAAVGIYAWDSSNGLATFSNVKELNDEAIAQVCQENPVEEWGYYTDADKMTNVTYDFSEGSVAATKDTASIPLTKEGTLKFWGVNSTWQIEGRMNRTDNSTSDGLTGFRISSGDKSTTIMARRNGFQRKIGTAKNAPVHREYSDYCPSIYSFNNIANTKFFNQHNTATRVQDWIDFKAVIYNDIFYVWFTDVNDNTGLCWRIPLTEEQFGEHTVGSEYQVEVYFANGTQADMSTTKLDVKMGYQVTGQENFTTDKDNRSYNLKDAAAKIEENITKYTSEDIKNDKTYFWTRNISGNLAEIELESSWSIFYTSEGKPGTDTSNSSNMTYDYALNRLTINKEQAGKTSAYFNATSETQVITGTFKTDMEEPTAYGITVKSGGKSVQVVANYGGGFRMQLDEGCWDTRLSVSNDAYSAVPSWKGTNPYADGELSVMVIVKQGVAYMYFDGQMIGSLWLSQLIPGYKIGDAVQLGVFGWDVNLGAAKEVVDLSQNIGENATAYMETNKITLTNEHMWTIARHDDTLYRCGSRNMTYNAAENKLTIDDKKDEDGTWAYFYGTSEKQAVSGTFKTDEEPATYGITVNAGGKSVQVVANKKGGFRMQQDETWKDGSTLSVSDDAHSAVPAWKGTNPYADGQLKVAAYVNQGKVYMFFDGQMIGSLDLTQVIPGYQVGDVVQLGVFGWKVIDGAASEVTDLSQAIGDDVAAYMTANQLTATDDHLWKIKREGNKFIRTN